MDSGRLVIDGCWVCGKLMVGFAMSWWLGWFDIAVSGGDGGGAVRGCGSKRGKKGRRERDRDE